MILDFSSETPSSQSHFRWHFAIMVLNEFIGYLQNLYEILSEIRDQEGVYRRLIL